VTISGNAASRLLEIAGGAKVTMSGLTLTDGLATDGAGILNTGDLTLAQDVFRGNTAQGITGHLVGRGGGVESLAGATLVVSQCTFAGNQALEALLSKYADRIPFAFCGHTHRQREGQLGPLRGHNVGSDYHFKHLLWLQLPEGTIEGFTFGNQERPARE